MAGFEGRFKVRKRLDTLTQEDKKKIHGTALSLLERVGIRIDSSIARKELKKAGATVDEASRIVKMPMNVVDDLLRSVPSNIVLAARRKEYDLPLDGTHFYFTTDGCGISVWNAKTCTRRESRLEDIRKTAIIADWLPNLSIYEPMVVAHDVPLENHVVSGLREAMVNNTKHIETESTTTPEEAKAQVQMASEVVGSVEELRKRHYISAMVCTISPLVLEGPATDAAMVWAENHVPVHITGMAMMGMSGPATVAGDIALNHAETLGLACAIQAHEPGAPVLYGSVLSSMNPKTGSVNLSSVEAMILGTCASEMARYVKFPCSCMGTGPGSMVPGPQAAIESSIITTLAAIAGSEVMNGMGLLDSSTVLSYEQLMIDNEMVGMALSAFRELPVNQETLAAEVIEKVGIGGTFLKEMHTLRHIREFYVPSLWPAESYDSWSKGGCTDILEVARGKAEALLKEHTPEPLDKDVSKRLDRIVKSFCNS
ncbi:MAG: hypothetical protein A3K60_08135 [Euryarchaeota archaeon RBG_19FT_COMBO_56_21]|nr:MAG: hypothetical protein A3K60_08135 [Euryarchaeota archaeon RBG_19FT_COMBO_56_21]